MGYSSVRGGGGELEGAYRRLESAQYFLFIINIVMLLVGLANFSVCMWIRWPAVAVPSCNFPLLELLKIICKKPFKINKFFKIKKLFKIILYFLTPQPFPQHKINISLKSLSQVRP